MRAGNGESWGGARPAGDPPMFILRDRDGTSL